MTPRDRIRAAVGPCAGVCPERHADLIVAAVTREPVETLGERACEHCGERFVVNQAAHRFCTTTCQKRAQTQRRRRDIRASVQRRAPHRTREYDPQKRYAWNVVAYRVRRGLLVPEPCEVCGEEPAQAHHDDYSRPAEVRWLCPLHHAEHHQEEETEAAALTRQERTRPLRTKGA